MYCGNKCFQEGQGLGKAEQGIVRALEVEKTSKRGGRIINDRDESPPPKAPGVLIILGRIINGKKK